MLDLVFMIITILILLWRIYTGTYSVGGEIFLPLAPTLIKFFWSYYKAERKATKQYIENNPEEFEE